MDILDLFGEPEPKNPSDKSGESELQLQLAELSDSSSRSQPAKDTLPIGVSPEISALARAVVGLSTRPTGFLQEPDLADVAFAVADLLERAGFGSEAIAAEQWAVYEASGRRVSKIEEARARADAVYRADLEAISEGWKPLERSSQSHLLWRQPEEPGKE